jgi:nicotinamide riboside kinase
MDHTMKKANIIIRMGAAHWDVKVLVPQENEYVSFDFRKMTGKEKSNFHREFMNAFRASR